MTPHRTDNGSLIFGLLFLGVVAWWLIAETTEASVGLAAIGWLVSAFLVTVGVVGVVAAIRSGRDSPPPR
ncbi:MAG: hypothetical protein ACRDTU_03560 [Micromonosporaceae bacterium]